jgi:hypothetical protein
MRTSKFYNGWRRRNQYTMCPIGNKRIWGGRCIWETSLNILTQDCQQLHQLRKGLTHQAMQGEPPNRIIVQPDTLQLRIIITSTWQHLRKTNWYHLEGIQTISGGLEALLEPIVASQAKQGEGALSKVPALHVTKSRRQHLTRCLSLRTFLSIRGKELQRHSKPLWTPKSVISQQGIPLWTQHE